MNDDKATSQSLEDELMKPAGIREKDPFFGVPWRNKKWII